MKSNIFINAIVNRNSIRFLYGLNEITVDPYFVLANGEGKKVLYGKCPGTNEIKKYEYSKISNIKVLAGNRFTPILPLTPVFN